MPGSCERASPGNTAMCQTSPDATCTTRFDRGADAMPGTLLSPRRVLVHPSNCRQHFMGRHEWTFRRLSFRRDRARGAAATGAASMHAAATADERHGGYARVGIADDATATPLQAYLDCTGWPPLAIQIGHQSAAVYSRCATGAPMTGLLRPTDSAAVLQRWLQAQHSVLQCFHRSLRHQHALAFRCEHSFMPCKRLRESPDCIRHCHVNVPSLRLKRDSLQLRQQSCT